MADTDPALYVAGRPPQFDRVVLHAEVTTPGSEISTLATSKKTSAKRAPPGTLVTATTYGFVEFLIHEFANLRASADGRTPWQVFEDKRRLGNSLLAPCSYVLKILPCRRWLTENTDPANTILYVGIDGSRRDRQRAPAIERGWSPWRVEFPLLHELELSKNDLLDEARALGLHPPRAYELGFDHANCGQLCVRGGQRHWLRTLEHFPERFADYEEREQRFRRRLGRDVAILKERRAGTTRPLPLTELRRRYQMTYVA